MDGFLQKLLIGISPNYTHDDIISSGTGERAKCAHYRAIDLPKCSVCFKKKKVHPDPSAKATAIVEMDSLENEPVKGSKDDLEVIVPEPPTDSLAETDAKKA